MDQPRDLPAFDLPTDGHSWRVVHLSDLHVVGERYGFRIESGRSGACGNERLARVLARLATVHVGKPLDLILITGDITDAGRSTEWAEFFTALDKHPDLARRTLLLPGNHDINVVDRANPARLDLPTSPGKRLRQMRMLSAMAAVQGDKVHVVDPQDETVGGTLAQRTGSAPCSNCRVFRQGIAPLVFSAGTALGRRVSDGAATRSEDGLGVLLLNSNAEAHFSFTNALGLVSAEQWWAMSSIVRQFPQAHWIVALHHHLVEYPNPAKAFSERIGTALINGTWLVRQLQSMSSRMVVMHGHRHIDWIGDCGGSAPFPHRRRSWKRRTTSQPVSTSTH